MLYICLQLYHRRRTSSQQLTRRLEPPRYSFPTAQRGNPLDCSPITYRCSPNTYSCSPNTYSCTPRYIQSSSHLALWGLHSAHAVRLVVPPKPLVPVWRKRQNGGVADGEQHASASNSGRRERRTHTHHCDVESPICGPSSCSLYLARAHSLLEAVFYPHMP